jgi:hypothetical protein
VERLASRDGYFARESVIRRIGNSPVTPLLGGGLPEPLSASTRARSIAANWIGFVKDAASGLCWSHVEGSGCEAGWGLLRARACVPEIRPPSERAAGLVSSPGVDRCDLSKALKWPCRREALTRGLYP